MYIYIIILFMSVFTGLVYKNYDNLLLLNDFRIKNNISLYNMASTIFYTTYMFACVKFSMCIQTLLNNWCVKEIEKNIYEVSFILNNKLIKVLVKVKKGPSKIMCVINDNNEDVTTIIQPFYNYKYVECTPDVYNYKSVEVLYTDGFEKIVRGEEVIN